jgi:hypothetical protein
MASSNTLCGNLARQPGTIHAPEPGIGDFTFATEAGAVTDADFQFVGSSSPDRTADVNAIRPHLSHNHPVHVERHVRRLIGAGIAEFVEQLFAHGWSVDHSPGAVDLSDGHRAVAADIGKR